ncbi:MAG: cell division protein FtsZ [Burkholderiales bacterium]|nr:cell division protein FtsZ [Burkholderiales bacterium]
MNLTTALIALALLVLGGIVVQGYWKARRLARRPGGLSVVVDDDLRREPTLGGDLAPTVGDELPAAAPARADGRLAPARRAVRLDALIDAIATLSVDGPMAGERVLPHLPGANRVGTKPFFIEGLNSETGEWETIAANARYSEFQAGVQMANRNGALNEIEFSEFVQKLETFAQSIGASTDLPDMLESVARARELDAFASQHDAQLVALLRANSVAWSVGYLQQVAQRHGFVPGAVPGRLVLPALEEGAPPVLVLGFDAQAALADDPGHAAVREMTLGLDVAQTEELAEPFAAWHGIARKLADDLDAAIVDDQGQPITLHAFSAIHAELTRLYEALMAHDLAAGSPGARRLFS